MLNSLFIRWQKSRLNDTIEAHEAEETREDDQLDLETAFSLILGEAKCDTIVSRDLQLQSLHEFQIV